MAFSNYKTVGEVLQQFQIKYAEANFIIQTDFIVSDYFREDLETTMRDGVVDNSEFAICENLVFPVLKEVWKSYRSQFILWSHQSLKYDEKLTGFPEYILARKSPLGKVVFDKPYFILVEAKQDNFEEGWAQCLAEMIAAQKLNNELQITVFGIVSNGSLWQFGNLEANLFTKNIVPYTIYELDKLFGAVNYIFKQCELQLSNVSYVS
ncbi:hypothetical protein [Scytonema sp. NUACC26]|uniref:hypothetical protein n=1 Tax=Scytonema sp. NUACC26 TaxID=3140176 RepID=UPI0034DC5456